MTKITDDEIAALWGDEIEKLVEAGFSKVSRNPSDHETAIAYRWAIKQAAAERDALIVAWLRTCPGDKGLAYIPQAYATAIEAGEHLK